MVQLPTGTVTFLFTDIEGSTRLWEEDPDAMRRALIRHDALAEQYVESYGGSVVRPRGEGDSRFAVFSRATDAVGAACSLQQALFAESWPTPAPLRVRIALHVGEAEVREGDYYGSAVNRCARLRAAAHGGQTLLSLATAELVRDALPAGAEMRDLGEHRLKDLARPERIFQLVIPNVPAEFPPLKTLESHPHNLPIQRTPLVGREREVATVRDLLRDPAVRLVTLTGPGGTGKTRLALQVAAEILDEFVSGVYFVALAEMSDFGLVAPTIAQTLGVQETGNQRLVDSLKDYLRDKQMLLVLDNFEQVVSAAPLVTELLAAAPQLKVLVTSREVLHVYGEHEFPVPPLALPDLKHLPPVEVLSHYAAVELFIQRALAVKPDFQVTNENAPAVAEICARLDGLPLALELAAARIKLFQPQAMLARLGHRLKWLTGGARDLPARQQTLRGAIDWSYDLLDAGEQTLFRRLAVFAGGCTIEAAEAICNAEADLPLEVLDGLASFVDKSLLKQEEGLDGEPRFVMLRTIREYAREKLWESEEAAKIHDRHLEYFLELAERAEPNLVGANQAVWFSLLEREHDNLRAAMEWALDGGHREAGLRVAASVWWFWHIYGFVSEGRRWLETLLAASEDASPPVKAKALYRAGHLAWLQGEYGQTTSLCNLSLSLSREVDSKHNSACSLVLLGYMEADTRRKVEMWAEALELFREAEFTWGVAYAVHLRGRIAHSQGRFEEAAALYEESADLWRQIGDPWGIGWSLNALAWVARARGDLVQAAALLEESLAVRKAHGYKSGIATSLYDLGNIMREQGNYERAAELFEESLALRRDLGAKDAIAWTLYRLGEVTSRRGDLSGAAAFYKESLALWRDLDRTRQANRAAGKSRSDTPLGDDERTTVLFEESLSLYPDREDKHGVALGLEGLAAVMVAQDRPIPAARLFGAAEGMREAISTRLDLADEAEYERRMALARDRIGVTDFTEAWAEGRGLTVERAIGYALDVG